MKKFVIFVYRCYVLQEAPDAYSYSSVLFHQGNMKQANKLTGYAISIHFRMPETQIIEAV